jgi:hypothetical protein
MNKIFTLFTFIFFSALNGQVSFVNEGSSLGGIASAGYQDCGVDMNGDYLDDVVRVTDIGIYIDYQQEDGSFVQEFFPLIVQNPPTWSICAGDIDRNGYNDLLFGNGTRVSFCYANADGTAYTEDPHPEYIFSQRSTFADIDNDGNLDAFVCHDVDQSHPYRNDGSGGMILDQTLIETLDIGGNYAAIWCDYDNDWDIDLYITKCRGGAPVGDPQRINLMYRNNGDGTFSEVGEEINMNDGEQSWTTVFEDFDNDGDFDAFIVNHTGANKLMENDGSGNFTDIITGSGIDPNDLGAWDCDAGDFNNDGFVDIFSELQDELYINNGDFTFSPQNLPFNNGGVADFNNDGFLDVIQDNNLWINQGNGNHWITIGCEGALSNINGIGSRIELYGDWGMQIREIRAGESFRPMSSLVEHFGIGSATSIDSILVKWPSGVISTILNPPIDQQIIVQEAECFADSFEIEVQGSTAICPGDSVELVSLEGEQVFWNTGQRTPSIFATSPGIYSATVVTDENCIATSNQVSITQIQEITPEILFTGIPEFCDGEEFELVATPGTSYLWSNGATTQSIFATEGGIYQVEIGYQCGDSTGLSQEVEMTVLETPENPEVIDINLDVPDEVTFTASGENLSWFETEFSEEEIAQGPAYTMPLNDGEATVYVEANSFYNQVVYGGKLDNSGGGGVSGFLGSLVFDTYETINLLAFDVYVLDNAQSGPGNRTFLLYDEDQNEIASLTTYLELGLNTVDVGWIIEEGSNYTITCAEGNIFRNNNGVAYPTNWENMAPLPDLR